MPFRLPLVSTKTGKSLVLVNNTGLFLFLSPEKFSGDQVLKRKTGDKRRAAAKPARGHKGLVVSMAIRYMMWRESKKAAGIFAADNVIGS